jgi:signal transduction histidine kinase
MRERLVTAFVALAVVVILMYGVPRAYFIADLVRDQEQHKAQRSAGLIAILVAEREQNAEPVTEQFLSRLLDGQEHLEYVGPDGTSVQAGPAVDRDSVVVSEQVSGGGRLTLSRSGTLLKDKIKQAILPLVTLGAALLVVAALLGFALAGRLSRPFRELAAAAHKLGAGRFDIDLPHYPVPEAEEIGSALRSSSASLDELLRREREFAANASHQLRTPLTALRLELEDLSRWPETAPEVSSQLTSSLHELDRLSGAVTDLLDLARGQRLSTIDDLELGALVDDAVERFDLAAASAGRALRNKTSGEVTARVPAGPVAQVLDVLVDNALKHGKGDIRVGAVDVGTHLRVRVSDDGVVPETVRDAIFRRHQRASSVEGEGIGLAVASEIAEALGGHLALADTPTTTFDLMLPRVRPYE